MNQYRTNLISIMSAVLVLATPAPAVAQTQGEPCLDLSPQVGTGGPGETWEITAATADGSGESCSDSAPLSGPFNIDFELSGANDPDFGHFPETPDLTCDVSGDGTSCVVVVNARTGPETIVVGWIDFDEDDSTPELDQAEALSEGEQEGDQPEPDSTAVTRIITSDYPPHCGDEVENDGDGLVDFPDDPGCRTPDDYSEEDGAISPECSNGIDDDGDTYIDYPDDAGCEVADDNDETGVEVRHARALTLKFAPWDYRFFGRLRSSAGFCRRRVPVVLKHVGTGRVVGRDRTNRTGRWRIFHEPRPGRYRAVVGSSFHRVGGTRHQCAHEVSPTLKIRTKD